MKPSEYMAFINELEARFPVDRWDIEGVPVWPIIRINLASALYRQNATSGKPTVEGSAGQLFGSLISDGFHCSLNRLLDQVHNQPVSRQEVFFLTRSIYRNYVDGNWFDIYADSLADLLEQLNHGAFTLEIPDRCRGRIPRYRSSSYMMPPLMKAIKNRLLCLGNEPFTGETYQNFTDYVKAELPGMNLSFLADVMVQASGVRAWAEYFKRILTEIHPRIAFTVFYYNQVGMGLNLACREMGIASCDIQHGLQGELHYAYGRWSKTPRGGYSLLPSIFWCWSQNEAAWLDRWCKNTGKGHRSFVGGNLWLQKWKSGQVPAIGRSDARPVHPTGNNDLQVLFSLQGNYRLPDWVIDAIAKTQGKYHWWLRLHPSMMDQMSSIDEELRQRGLTNYNLKEASRHPLPAILRQTSVHITQCSSVIIDAETFGIPSVATHPLGLESFPEHFKAGWVVPAVDEVSLIEAISSQNAARSALVRITADIDSAAKLRELLKMVDSPIEIERIK